MISTSFFSLSRQKCRLRDGRVMPSYYVLDLSHWVHVIPITYEKQIIMIRQYRHSLEDWFWEFPGGAVDPKDKSPLAAGQRELLEETGFYSENWEELLRLSPNPALQNNKLYIYTAFNCLKKREPAPEPFEDMECHLLSLSEWEKLIKERKISHALMSASLYAAVPLIRSRLR